MLTYLVSFGVFSDAWSNLNLGSACLELQNDPHFPVPFSESVQLQQAGGELFSSWKVYFIHLILKISTLMDSGDYG